MTSRQNGVGEAAAKEESRNPTPIYCTWCWSAMFVGGL
jgi:hypothetical protein